MVAQREKGLSPLEAYNLTFDSRERQQEEVRAEMETELTANALASTWSPQKLG